MTTAQRARELALFLADHLALTSQDYEDAAAALAHYARMLEAALPGNLTEIANAHSADAECGLYHGPERGQLMHDKPFRVLAKIWATREKTLEEWRRFNDLYHLPRDFVRQHKPARIKWGQPGKRRRRKARLAARLREHQLQRLLVNLRALSNGSLLPLGSVSMQASDA